MCGGEWHEAVLGTVTVNCARGQFICFLVEEDEERLKARGMCVGQFLLRKENSLPKPKRFLAKLIASGICSSTIIPFAYRYLASCLNRRICASYD